MPETARLKVRGEGGVEVALVRDFLNDLEGAYDAILAFEILLDQQTRFIEYAPFVSFVGLRRPRRLGRIPFLALLPTREEIEVAVPASEALRLLRVRFESPGFWEFLGNLNAMEVIRKYLQDRHERRKDKDYRETAERRRLDLENLQRETTMLSERIKLAKELGATDRDLAPLINHLVNRPLQRLDRYQDKGIIDDVDFWKEG